MIISSLLCMTLVQTPQQATKNPVPPPQPPAAVAAPGAVSSLEKGLALYKRQQFQAARMAFQQAVDAEPENAAAHYYLGYTLYKIAEPTKRLTPEKQAALQHFSRCFE